MSSKDINEIDEWFMFCFVCEYGTLDWSRCENCEEVFCGGCFEEHKKECKEEDNE